jgi:hypothetical protein
MKRRLEDRIAALCSKAVGASDPRELNKILQELKAALKEHTHRIRETAPAVVGAPVKPNRRVD